VLVGTDWLAAHLDDPDVMVVDMRWREDGSAWALYEQGHIPSAAFLDWTKDIVDPEAPIVFMLAPPDRFAAAMERSGIGDDSRVVAYSDGFGSGPHRLWWAARVYGHDQVRVLDGGLEKWIAEARPLSSDPPRSRQATWTARPLQNPPLARAEDVLAAARDDQAVVLDSRSPEQFRGEAVWFETGSVRADNDGIARTARGDIRAGHVPWAISIPVTELYRPDGTLKSGDELRELFSQAGVTDESRAITYCGVGVSASALMFGLVRAGFENVALYDASWDEWGRDPDKPLKRGV
jgi:thiosulfate/3-mercaptopyruvate sulfurtransferase